jgi:hypothetical protein
MASDSRGSGYVKVPFGSRPTVGSLPMPQRRAPQGAPQISTGMQRNINAPGPREVDLGRKFGKPGNTERQSDTGRDDGPGSGTSGITSGTSLASPESYNKNSSPLVLALGTNRFAGEIGPAPHVRPHGGNNDPLPLVSGDQTRGALPFTAGGPRISGPGPRSHGSGGAIGELGMDSNHSRGVGHINELSTYRGPRDHAIDATATVRPRSKAKQAARDVKARASWENTPGF